MERRDIEAFLSRDWARVAQAKDEHWQAIKQQRGATAALRMADELRQHAQAIHPEWPTSDEREEDLEVHRATSAILRRTPALASR